MKKILALTLAFGMIFLTACSTESTADTSTETDVEVQETVEEDKELDDIVYVTIEVENYGTIKLELYHDIAPITVENFVSLVEEGFYDGLTFHRIIYGFMIQGGDPLGNGTGGSDETITGEFSSNGIENSLSHTRGVISMARSSANDSASSQFFIMHEDATYLDGSYAAFGMVTEGMDVVDEIAISTIVSDSNGTVESENQPVITSITIDN